jgi:thioesterase domain-containing protein
MPTTTAAEVRARPRRDVNLEPMQIADAPNTSLVALKPSGAGTPLFMVHQGYGQVFQYKRIAERLREDIPVYAFEAQGLRDGLEPRTSVEDMAAAYLEDLRRIRPTGPYLLAGFSYGGHVAWAMAHELVKDGEDIRLLMIDIGPPVGVTPKMNPVRKFKRVLTHHWKTWRGLEGPARKAYRVSAFRDEAYAVADRLHLDPTGRLYQAAIGVGKRKSQASGFLPVFRANMRAMDGWEFKPYPRPVTLFRATLQPPNRPDRPTLGFQPQHVPGGIDVHAVPGTHTFLFHEPHVNEFVVQLEEWVDRQDLDPSLPASGDAPAQFEEGGARP